MKIRYGIKFYQPECHVKFKYEPIKWYYRLWNSIDDEVWCFWNMLKAGVMFGCALGVMLMVATFIGG